VSTTATATDPGKRQRGWGWTGRLAEAALHALVVALFVVLVTFVLVRAVPGDPALAILGKKAPPAALEALRNELHTNDSLPQQFAQYMGGLMRGDLGDSIVQQGNSVMSIVGDTLPVTLAVIAGGLLTSVAIGIPLGLLAALSRRTGVDASVRAVTVLLISTPTAFLALVLLLMFALNLDWLPAGGWGDGWPDNLRYLVLPSLALAGGLAPFIARTVRQTVLDVAGRPFVEAALARGIPERAITRKHILPNSLLPVLTLLGINIGLLVTGAVVVEAVFDIPGIGSELVTAMGDRDYPLIQGIAIATALVVVLGNLLADAAYVLVDPRTRRT
jgi:peptide/nickel transport system permease protein